MDNSNLNKAERMRQIALEYLQNAYKDCFTALSYSNKNWAYRYETVTFRSERYCENVQVRIYEDNGSYVFKDNYFRLTMREQAEQYFRAFTAQYGYQAEAEVRFIALGTEEINANTPFADYIANGKCNLEVYFLSHTVFSEKDVQSILNDLCKAKIMGLFRFVAVKDAVSLAQCSIRDIAKGEKVGAREMVSFTINRKFEINE